MTHLLQLQLGHLRVNLFEAGPPRLREMEGEVAYSYEWRVEGHEVIYNALDHVMS